MPLPLIWNNAKDNFWGRLPCSETALNIIVFFCLSNFYPYSLSSACSPIVRLSQMSRDTKPEAETLRQYIKNIIEKADKGVNDVDCLQSLDGRITYVGKSLGTAVGDLMKELKIDSTVSLNMYIVISSILWLSYIRYGDILFGIFLKSDHLKTRKGTCRLFLSRSNPP